MCFLEGLVTHSLPPYPCFQGKLDEAVSLATGFQTSLQDTINWLTQAEQTLNVAQPPSLILDTVLFQIDEHKVAYQYIRSMFLIDIQYTVYGRSIVR